MVDVLSDPKLRRERYRRAAHSRAWLWHAYAAAMLGAALSLIGYFNGWR